MAHLAILWHQKHTDFPGPGKTEHNIVGSRLWPQYTVKSTALLMFIAAVVFGLGGLVQINPIWLYGPYQAARSSAATQPDWYVGWLDGALRLWPHWEFRSFGHEIANPFFPGLLLPGIVFGVIYTWPWLDKRIYADYGEHNLLDRPRDKPLRTAVGVAALLFFADLTLASATDVIGNALGVSFELLIEILQYGSFIGPAVGGSRRLPGLSAAAAFARPSHPAAGRWHYLSGCAGGVPHRWGCAQRGWARWGWARWGWARTRADDVELEKVPAGHADSGHGEPAVTAASGAAEPSPDPHETGSDGHGDGHSAQT